MFDPLPDRIQNARIYGIVGTGSFLFVNGDKLFHTWLNNEKMTKNERLDEIIILSHKVNNLQYIGQETPLFLCW